MKLKRKRLLTFSVLFVLGAIPVFAAEDAIPPLILMSFFRIMVLRS